jgi:hypothetical protein
VGEDGFVSEEVKLFLLSLHETMTLPSGDDHCIGFRHSSASPIEYWIMERLEFAVQRVIIFLPFSTFPARILF